MLHIVTVATESKYYYPYLVKTCAEWKVNLTTLGMSEKWGGYVWKFKKVLTFLKSIDPNDIVCFVDGYDVVCTRDLNELVPMFLKIKARENCDIIIAKDQPLMFPFDKVLQLYFGSCNGTRINSGTYIGHAKDVLNILQEATRLQPDEQDDQRLLTGYCSLYANRFYIDKKAELFQVNLIPLTEAKLPKKRAFFIHAAGCGYLTNVLTEMGYEVPPQIKRDLRKYLIKKEFEHIIVFITRYFLWIIAIIVVLILIVRYVRAMRKGNN
jgi:hypothetical protein